MKFSTLQPYIPARALHSGCCLSPELKRTCSSPVLSEWRLWGLRGSDTVSKSYLEAEVGMTHLHLLLEKRPHKSSLVCEASGSENNTLACYIISMFQHDTKLQFNFCRNEQQLHSFIFTAATWVSPFSSYVTTDHFLSQSRKRPTAYLTGHVCCFLLRVQIHSSY